jgi:phosphonoacetaldehyde hydrolase
MREIKTLVLDWAGTTVDYGCLAPVDAFRSAFEAFGVSPTSAELRAPMGLAKRAHIATMLRGERLGALWREAHGHSPGPADVDAVYDRFEPALYATLADHAEPLPGVLEAVARIREMGVAIGSTTGYTREMMDVVAPLARAAGYAPDAIVCPDDTGGVGRPAPYMLWRNLERLGTPSIHAALKVGDTAADMAEGRNAGCLTVGVLRGSSMVGLSEAELAQMPRAEVGAILDAADQAYLHAGADFVIADIGELPRLIESLGQRPQALGATRHPHPLRATS